MKIKPETLATLKSKIIEWAKTQTRYDFHEKSLLYFAVQYMKSYSRSAATMFIIESMTNSEIDSMFGEVWDALKKENIV